MPKNRWSSKDERQYQHIFESCIIRARKNGKKGAVRVCKRIAAATVNRDRALGDLGLGNVFEESLDRTLRYVGPMDGRRRRGLGAQALSLSLPAGEFAGGLRGRWKSLTAVDRNAVPGSVFKQKGDRYAIISEDEDGDGDFLLGFYQGPDMGTLEQSDYEVHRTFEDADRAAKRRGFDGLRGTPAQHRKEATTLLDAAAGYARRYGYGADQFGREHVDALITRARQEGRWLPKRDKAAIERRAFNIKESPRANLRGTPTQHAEQARLLMSEANSWGWREGPLAEMEFAARAAEEAQWSGDPDLERKADRFFHAAERGAKRSTR